jgi:type IV pilus assembly protein PilB
MNADAQDNLKGFSRYLVSAGLLDTDNAVEATDAAKKENIPLISHVVGNGLVSSKKIAVLASQEFGLPYFDLSSISNDSLPMSEVEGGLIAKHHVLPLLKRGNRLFLAASDPTNQEAIKEIQFNTGLAIELILVEEDKLAILLEEATKTQEQAMGALLEENLENIDFDIGGESDSDGADQSEIDEAPVVRFVNKILLDAINSGVSDIHFEPYEKSYRIRYRQDGLLFEKASPPVNIAQRLSSRLKVMARLNIAERRVPQDGRIKLKVSKHHAIDFRVNTCPTVYGEKVVLRILDASAATIGVDALGFEEDQKEIFMKAIKKPYGMILVTGPTGSGKTVTLYTALNILNDPQINISTAEDPVEIQVEGINQVNINTASGLHFADALRAFLRQDPDIIMVGEIRDLETGEIAVKAAQTGHMVLSTLHTNDAPQTLTRLANMGIPPYNIASSVNVIMAQRLGRRLCEHCKEPEDIPRTALLEEGFTESDVSEGLTLYKAVGCNKCNNGYKGRVGIFEILPVSEGIAQIILEEGNAMQLKEQALKEGYYYDLRTAGLLKVKNGLTSLEEVNRITKD